MEEEAKLIEMLSDLFVHNGHEGANVLLPKCFVEQSVTAGPFISGGSENRILEELSKGCDLVDWARPSALRDSENLSRCRACCNKDAREVSDPGHYHSSAPFAFVEKFPCELDGVGKESKGIAKWERKGKYGNRAPCVDIMLTAK